MVLYHDIFSFYEPFKKVPIDLDSVPCEANLNLEGTDLPYHCRKYIGWPKTIKHLLLSFDKLEGYSFFNSGGM